MSRSQLCNDLKEMYTSMKGQPVKNLKLGLIHLKLLEKQTFVAEAHIYLIN